LLFTRKHDNKNVDEYRLENQRRVEEIKLNAQRTLENFKLHGQRRLERFKVKGQIHLEDYKLKGQFRLEYVKLSHSLSIEEFKSLRSEIDARFRDSRSLEVYITGGLIAYYAWLITHCVPTLPGTLFGIHIPDSFPWLIAVLFPLLGSWRALVNTNRVLNIASYIRNIENNFDGLDGDGKRLRAPGWEKEIDRIRTLPDAGKFKRGVLYVLRLGSHVFFWLFMFGLTVFASVYGGDVTARVCRGSAMSDTLGISL
jgi:hypothetical protein